MVEETAAIDRRSKGRLQTLVLVSFCPAVTVYNARDTTRRTGQNASEAASTVQLVSTDSPEAMTTQDRSSITYLPKNQDGPTRRTQHNNL
jgi:hypothetical protein